MVGRRQRKDTSDTEHTASVLLEESYGLCINRTHAPRARYDRYFKGSSEPDLHPQEGHFLECQVALGSDVFICTM